MPSSKSPVILAKKPTPNAEVTKPSPGPAQPSTGDRFGRLLEEANRVLFNPRTTVWQEGVSRLLADLPRSEEDLERND